MALLISKQKPKSLSKFLSFREKNPYLIANWITLRAILKPLQTTKLIRFEC